MKKIGILLLIALFVTGCSDYLQEDNRSSITTDEYYATQSGYESLVTACYSTLRELYSDMNSDDANQNNFCSMEAMTMLGTDLFCAGHLADQNDIMDGYFLLTPDHWAVSEVFSNGYQSIQLHNVALDWAENTVQFEELPVRVAEVRFIRAYTYHILQEQFGRISIVTEAFDQPISSFERDTEADIYNFIITELKEIIPVLPDMQDQDGRVTKAAAQHLLALVHLSRGYSQSAQSNDFQMAEDYATDVIESNQYALLPSFDEVFRVGNEVNREIIFSIQFDRGSLYQGVGGHTHHSWGGSYAAVTEGWPYRHGQIRPTDWCYEQYAQGDKRYQGTFMVQRYDPYYDFYNDAKPESDKVVTYVYPHHSVERDTANPAPTNWIFFEDYTVFVPASEEWEIRNYPWVRKFDDPLSNDRDDNSRDIFVFRLAETYLIRAEAKIKQGESGDDDIYTVRRRSWDVEPVGATIDTVLDERGRELMGEYKRWMDLRRMGKVQERVSVHNPSVLRYYDQGYDPFNNGFKALRRPIPTDVIIRDGQGYGQNDGY